MTLGVTDDQNYVNIANALREMGSGAEDLAFKPSEIPAAIRGLRSIWGTIEGSILDQIDLQNALDAKAAANHNHDDRYYTESEIDTKLNGKSNTGHTHDDRYYTESEIDTKLNNKSNITHTHDERYYTEAEIDDKFDESTIIKSTSGPIVSFDDGVAAPAGNVTVAIEPVQEGSGDPSPDNVRPITGWTGAKVMRTGRNLLPLKKNIYISNPGTITATPQYDNDNNVTSVIINGTSDINRTTLIQFSARIAPDALMLPIGNYIFSIGNYLEGITIQVGRNSDSIHSGTFIPYNSAKGPEVNFTQDKPFCLTVQLGIPKNTTINNLIVYPMIRLASDSDDTYEPYQGDTYDISFGKAGTVYGGSLDVSSGVLTLDMASVTLNGSENWNISGTGTPYYFYFLPFNSKERSLINQLSNIYITSNIKVDNTVQGFTIGAKGGTEIRIRFREEQSLNEFKNELASQPLQIVYSLATPLTYQLTPTEVTTLLGQNNIWADTGDVDVSYWRDETVSKSVPSAASVYKALIDIDNLGMKRYGVSGYGASDTNLTRTFDAVGMVAEVGTDGDNSGVCNDFDNTVPFMRRKCVGEWTLEDGRAVFHVKAYYGDADYTEDGSMGDYVAVECPRCYYYRNGEHLIISAHQYPGYRPFDIFCRNHNPADTMPFVYLPAYALALKDGKAVSLPGLENENGAWDELLGKARTYADGALGNKAMMLPASVAFYEEALMTVEFATTNLQNIMRSACDMRSDANTRCKFLDQTHILVTDWAQAAQTSIAGWNANWRLPGDYISVLAESVSDIYNGTYRATHKIISVTRCDENGTASTSGKYSKLEVQDLGKNYWTYDYTGATNYKLGGRAHFTGEANSVSTPSGSPISLTDGHHVMKYRWRENVYGNQYWNSADVFIMRVGTGDSDYYLDWYYLNDPEIVDTFNDNNRPNATDLASENFTKLDLITPHEKYANGYIKSKKFSDLYPDIWIPNETTGGSATTFFCDNAYLVNSNVVRALRFGGAWTNGSYAGPSLVLAYHAVSSGNASYGAHLFIKQG